MLVNEINGITNDWFGRSYNDLYIGVTVWETQGRPTIPQILRRCLCEAETLDSLAITGCKQHAARPPTLLRAVIYAIMLIRYLDAIGCRMSVASHWPRPASNDDKLTR